MLRQFLSLHSRALFPSTHCRSSAVRLLHASRPLATDLDKEIEAITDLATTAKDEMDFAEESRNSVYYNDDKMAAHDAVEEMTSAYNGLLARLSAADKATIETRIGMRIKEIQSAYEIMTLNDMED
ncbi:hypothetical protein IWW37_003603 [Coemansia sp. RSA 2050]|nr:hypothetical protein IWW37_003603 [Coemansia sp. RSA 2050]KAJ2732495.1 hypothetical protein IW152_003771 [Coemansia sp. BCRC 34962]